MTVLGKRLCPPGVTNAATSPWSAHRRKVAGVMPRRRLASPRLSHGERLGLRAALNLQIMLKTDENYKPLDSAPIRSRALRESDVSGRMGATV